MALSFSRSYRSYEPTRSGFTEEEEAYYHQRRGHQRVIIIRCREHLDHLQQIEDIPSSYLAPFGEIQVVVVSGRGRGRESAGRSIPLHLWKYRTREGERPRVRYRVNDGGSDAILEVTLENSPVVLSVHVPLDSWERETCDAKNVRAALQIAYVNMIRRDPPCPVIVHSGQLPLPVYLTEQEPTRRIRERRVGGNDGGGYPPQRMDQRSRFASRYTHTPPVLMPPIVIPGYGHPNSRPRPSPRPSPAMYEHARHASHPTYHPRHPPSPYSPYPGGGVVGSNQYGFARVGEGHLPPPPSYSSPHHRIYRPPERASSSTAAALYYDPDLLRHPVDHPMAPPPPGPPNRILRARHPHPHPHPPLGPHLGPMNSVYEPTDSLILTRERFGSRTTLVSHNTHRNGVDEGRSPHGTASQTLVEHEHEPEYDYHDDNDDDRVSYTSSYSNGQRLSKLGRDHGHGRDRDTVIVIPGRGRSRNPSLWHRFKNWCHP
ncbi:hypothetical protein FRC15_005766, partial [Serendipita sp. 397]